MHEKTYTHEATGIAATQSEWQMIDENIGFGTGLHVPPRVERILMLAVIETGDKGANALAWAAREIQRRSEAKTYATAIARLAEAVKGLAGKRA